MDRICNFRGTEIKGLKYRGTNTKNYLEIYLRKEFRVELKR